MSSTQLTIGQWHTLRVTRINGVGELLVDDQSSPVVGNSSGTGVALNVGSSTYVGGVPNGVTVPSGAVISGGRCDCGWVTLDDFQYDVRVSVNVCNHTS